MRKSNWYRMCVSDLLYLLLACIIGYIVFIISRTSVKEVTLAQLPAYLIVVMLVGGNGIFSYSNYSSYNIFCFYRRRFRKEQLMINVFRAAFLSCMQCMYNILYREDFVKLYFEFVEENLKMQTHRLVLFWQMFVLYFLLYYAIFVISMLNRTLVSVSKITIKTLTPQMLERKEKHMQKCWLFRCAYLLVRCVYLLVILIGFLLISVALYEVLMVNTVKIWLICVLVSLVVNGILILCMMKRYTPRYI